MTKRTVSLAAYLSDTTRVRFSRAVPIHRGEVIAAAAARKQTFCQAFLRQKFDITEHSSSNCMNITSLGICHNTAASGVIFAVVPAYIDLSSGGPRYRMARGPARQGRHVLRERRASRRIAVASGGR
jgi:hypothetical protein